MNSADGSAPNAAPAPGAARDARPAAALGRATDPMTLMQRVADRTLELVSAANGVLIGLADQQGVTYVCGAGHHDVSHLGTRVSLDTSLSGLAVRTGQTMRSDDTDTDPRVDGLACRRLSVASAVCVPLAWMDQTIGVLAVNAARPHAFGDADVVTLARLAEFVSVAIGSAHDLNRVSERLLDMSEPTGETRAAGGTAPNAADTVSRYMMGILSPETITRFDSGRRIRHVLDHPEVLSMVFQPIVDLTGDRVTAVEALARFDAAPIRPPDAWFRDAHQAGLGVELELLAATRALEQLPMLPDEVALAINIGPESVMSDEFADALSSVSAHRVIIELTEHTSVDDYPALVACIQALRRRGVRLAVDDTGSGYSSLAHILKLAPDFIKLDRDLATTIDLDPVRRALAAALVSFASETGAHIIAEGVENRDELEVLRRLGVRYGQGYHLGRPGALELLADTLRRTVGAPRAKPRIS